MQERTTFTNFIVLRRLQGQLDMSDEDIADEVATVASAAVDTVASTLNSIFKMLSLYPDLQQRVYEEVCVVLQDESRPITVADLPA